MCTPSFIWYYWQHAQNLYHMPRPLHTPSTTCSQESPYRIKRRHQESPPKMVDQGIITPITEPTEWVSSLTYPHKPDGTLHLCLDPCDFNKAITREHYKTPTLGEISHQLSSATVFKTWCQRWILEHPLGHPLFLLNQIQHTHTHIGCYQFHMPCGLTISQDVFQIQMEQITNRLPGIITIHNDICIYGKQQRKTTNTYFNLWK